MSGAGSLIELLVQCGVPAEDAVEFVDRPTDLLGGESAAQVAQRDPQRALTATRRFLAFWLDQRAPGAPRRGEWGW
ncbi:hypothetical protein SAMN05660748_0701 [Blastococcus aggregatus]|uniref:Uncharacterized protein n=1 Tax=Blastococcus aggregatus TaxID=38502 RepID=A0A285V2J0_9ACTN|nr:hypothetical protein [Blastococcus aggregatus]SOC47226.1 hypothetical protein SAMN05660748_0701 [Blastococcus aggregatus]